MENAIIEVVYIHVANCWNNHSSLYLKCNNYGRRKVACLPSSDASKLRTIFLCHCDCHCIIACGCLLVHWNAVYFEAIDLVSRDDVQSKCAVLTANIDCFHWDDIKKFPFSTPKSIVFTLSVDGAAIAAATVVVVVAAIAHCILIAIFITFTSTILMFNSSCYWNVGRKWNEREKVKRQENWNNTLVNKWIYSNDSLIMSWSELSDVVLYTRKREWIIISIYHLSFDCTNERIMQVSITIKRFFAHWPLDNHRQKRRMSAFFIVRGHDRKLNEITFLNFCNLSLKIECGGQ